MLLVQASLLCEPGVVADWTVLVPGRAASLFISHPAQLPCFFLVVHNFDISKPQTAAICSHFAELSRRLATPMGRGVGLIAGDFNFPHDSGVRWKGDEANRFCIDVPSPNDQTARRAWRPLTANTMLATDHAPTYLKYAKAKRARHRASSSTSSSSASASSSASSSVAAHVDVLRWTASAIDHCYVDILAMQTSTTRCTGGTSENLWDLRTTGISDHAPVGVLVSRIASRRAKLFPPLPRWVTSSPAFGLETTKQIRLLPDIGSAFELLASIKDIIRKTAASTERLIRRGAAQRPAIRAARLVSAAAALERGNGTAI